MAYDKYKKAYPATDCQGQGQGEKIFQTKSARKRAPPDGEPGNETGKRGGNRSDTIEIKLKGFDCFPKTASKWNANEDIAGILVSAQSHPEWITEDVRLLAPSGSQILYRRKEGLNPSHYKQDGYLWKKRKDGKLPREDHMKLKVKGVELIYANYVHSALVPTFHRRAYWMLANPDVILVHYLNVLVAPSPETNNQSLTGRLVNCIRPHASYGRQDLTDQLTAILSSPVMNYHSAELPATRGWLEKLVDEVKTQFYAESELRNCQEPTDNTRSTPAKKRISLAQSPQVMENVERPSSSHSQILRIPSSVQQIIVQYQVQQDTQGDVQQPVFIEVPSGPTINGIDGQPEEQKSVCIGAPTSPKINRMGDSSVVNTSSPILVSVDPVSPADVTESTTPNVQKSLSLGVSGSEERPGTSKELSPGSGVFQIPIARSSSCSSAFRKGMSSFAMSRQPSAFSDTVDDVFLNGAAMNAYVGDGGNQGQPAEDSVTSESHHEDSAYNSFSDPREMDYLGLIQDREEDRAMPIRHFRENPVLGGGERPMGLAETLGLNTEEISETLNANSTAMESFGFDSMALLQRYLNDSMTEGDVIKEVERAEFSGGACSREDENRDNRDDQIMWRGNQGNRESAVGVATILDYSPDWAYSEGGVKILIGGPWYLSGHEYSCLFDQTEVPATLVQTGIIRCFCPAHDPGCVSLKVSCDGQVISNWVNFTYKANPALEDSHSNSTGLRSQQKNLSKKQSFVLGLLERFEHMEKYLEKAGSDGADNTHHNTECFTGSKDEIPSIGDLEERFVRICDGMSRLEWVPCQLQEWRENAGVLPDILLSARKGNPLQESNLDTLQHHEGMKLLHFAAALGFSRLIAAMLRWRAEKPSSILNTEIDPICLDDLGRTPLFLACQQGNLGTARLLAEYNQMALRIVDRDGTSPLKEAGRRGHRSLVESLIHWAVAKERRENRQKILLSNQSCSSSSNRVLDSTTLWVLSGGESVTNQATDAPPLESQQHQPVSDHKKDALQQKLSLDSAGNNILRTNRRGSIVRECTKRASVEELDALLRQTGETEPKVTKQAWDEGGGGRCDSPLSVEIPMDVEVPDSPEMLDMWEQVTSPGAVVHEGARAQMASLAQQIIDALPDRIKQEGLLEEGPQGEIPPLVDLEAFNLSSDDIAACFMEDSRTSAFANYRFIDSLTPCSSVQSPGGSSVSMLMTPPKIQHYHHSAPPIQYTGGDQYARAPVVENQSSSVSCGLANAEKESTEPESPTSTMELGAFFNAYRMRKSPLERHFQDLALNDREQRELYEAARIIQTAFRQYKSRVTVQRNERQLESERNAAIVIQSYYRRYKQYCYFKKLHRAALLIQKHFRLHKKASKDAPGGSKSHRRRGVSAWQSSASCSSAGFDLSGAQDEEEFWEFAAAAAAADADSDCFRMKVNPDELAQWRKHLAAIRIQHAFRGHYMRKRQAAARKIQKFMRESRQKLLRARGTGGSGLTRVQLSSQLGCRSLPGR